MNSLATRRRRILALSVLAQLCVGSHHVPAEESAQPGENLGKFRLLYYFSFMVDKCVDLASGETLRKAITDKLDQCPFSPATKDGFRHESDSVRATAMSNIGYLERQGLKVCPDDEPDAAVEYSKIRRTLGQYSKGEIGVNAVTWESCDSEGVGHP
jgi:hypothetical protein